MFTATQCYFSGTRPDVPITLQTHLEYIPTPFVTSSKQGGMAKTTISQLCVQSAGNPSRCPTARGTTLLPRAIPANLDRAHKNQIQLEDVPETLSASAKKKKPWQTPFLPFPHGAGHVAGTLVSLDVPRLLKSTRTQPQNPNTGLEEELGEGNVSHSRGWMSWCNQLYPKNSGSRTPSPHLLAGLGLSPWEYSQGAGSRLHPVSPTRYVGLGVGLVAAE